jgi:penicillin G amidase
MRAWGHGDARDRAFQMDLTRRFAAGTVSALVGAGALDLDQAQRELRLRAAAAANVEILDPEQRCWLEAYADGVNDRLARRPAALEHRMLRVRMEPWRPEDTLLVMLGLTQQLALDIAGERTRAVVRALLPKTVAAFLLPRTDEWAESPEAVSVGGGLVAAIEELVAAGSGRSPVDVVGLSPTGASNCWVVGPSLTAHGHPVLANDMHLATGAPNVFRRVDLALGPRRIRGFAVPGVPVVACGSNGDLAWGLANVPADYTRLVPVEETELTRTVERIEVLRSHAVEHEVRLSPAGPVLRDLLLGRAVALQWAGHRPGYADLGWVALATATTVEQGVDVLGSCGGLPVAVVLADRHGGTARTVGGRFPRTAADDLLPGEIDPAERPVRRGAANEVLVAANDPWRPGDGQDVGRNHPTAYRRARVADVMAARDDWDELSVARVQEDAAAGLLDAYRPAALEALATVAHEPRRSQLAWALDRWDGTQTSDSRGVALLWAFRVLVQRRLMASLLRDCAATEPSFQFTWRNPEPVIRALLHMRPRVLDGLPGADDGWPGFLATALEDAADAVEQAARIPVHEARWRDVVSVTARHPIGGTRWTRWLDLPALVPVGGPESVAAYTGTSGPVQRLVVAPGREQSGLVGMPGGQSGNPLSLHYRDQHRAWRRRRLAPLVLPDRRRSSSPR